MQWKRGMNCLRDPRYRLLPCLLLLFVAFACADGSSAEEFEFTADAPSDCKAGNQGDYCGCLVTTWAFNVYEQEWYRESVHFWASTTEQNCRHKGPGTFGERIYYDSLYRP